MLTALQTADVHYANDTGVARSGFFFEERPGVTVEI